MFYDFEYSWSLLGCVSVLCLYLWSRRRRQRKKLAPVIGSTFSNAVAFTSGGSKLFALLKKYCGVNKPIRFTILGFSIFLINNDADVRQVILDPHNFVDNDLRARFIRNVLGVPRKATDVIEADDSGSGKRPLPGSNVPEHRRIHRMQQESTFDLLNSKAGLQAIEERFTTFAESYLEECHIGEGWIEHPDFFDFVRRLASTAMTNAVCGTKLIEKNADFIDQFWIFDMNVHSLYVCWPKWLNRTAHEAREYCVNAFINWRKDAKEESRGRTYTDADMWDNVWGYKAMRQRNEMYDQFPEFDHDRAQAGANLGFIWACNDNLVPMAYWFIHALLTTPSLLSRCVASMNKARVPTTPEDTYPDFDSEILIKQPLLQSVYHEVLRTKVVSIMARSAREDSEIGGYHVPKGSISLTVPWLFNHDSAKWETRPGAAEHAVNEFWPERFLVYPEQAKSSDAYNEKTATPASTHIRSANSADVAGAGISSEAEPEFSTKWLEGMFLPFGGGTHMCPGRNFSSRAILKFAAILISTFEFQAIGEEGWDHGELDDKSFGHTPARPIRNLPFKVRRKPVGEASDSSVLASATV